MARPLTALKKRYLIAAAVVNIGALAVGQYFFMHEHLPKPQVLWVFLALPFLLAVVVPLRTNYIGRLLIVAATLILAAMVICGVMALCLLLRPRY